MDIGMRDTVRAGESPSEGSGERLGKASASELSRVSAQSPPRCSHVISDPTNMAVAPGNGGRPPSPPDRAPKPPLIPLELFPAPEQRLTAVAVLVLLQAWKLADLLSPQPNVSTASAGLALAAIVQDDLINSKLLKWIAIDLLAVSILGTLRIPRLDLKWKGLLVLRVALCLLDYILFGQWTVSSAQVSSQSQAIELGYRHRTSLDSLEILVCMTTLTRLDPLAVLGSCLLSWLCQISARDLPVNSRKIDKSIKGARQ